MNFTLLLILGTFNRTCTNSYNHITYSGCVCPGAFCIAAADKVQSDPADKMTSDVAEEETSRVSFQFNRINF